MRVPAAPARHAMGPPTRSNHASAGSDAPAKLDTLRAALCGVIILSVCRIQEVYPQIGALRPGMALIGLAAGAVLVDRSAMADSSWTKRWPTKLLVWILLATLCSIGFGISQGSAFMGFLDVFSKVLVAAFLLIVAIRGVRHLWLFTWAFVIGCGFLVWLCMFVFGTVTDPGGIARLDTRFTWDANDVGLIALIGLPLSMLAFRTSGRLGKLVCSGVALGLAATIAKTGSRGAFVGLAAVLFAYLFSLKGTSVARRILVVGAVVLGAIVAAPSGYMKQMNTVANAKEDYNWDAPTGRRQVWIRGLGYIASYPIFGVGISNFGRAEGQISERAIKADPNGPAIKWSAAHNSYIQAVAEIGIPGGFVFCALVFGCIVLPWRLRKRIPPGWAKGAGSSNSCFRLPFFFPWPRSVLPCPASSCHLLFSTRSTCSRR